MLKHYKIINVLALIVGVVIAATSVSAEPRISFEIDSPVTDERSLQGPPTVKIFAPQLITLWIEALESPEADMHAAIAHTISKAHKRGMPGLKQCIPPLLEQLSAEKQTPQAALQIAIALIDLNATEAAEQLYKLEGMGNDDITPHVDAALARWDYKPARESWRKRAISKDAGFQVRLSAIKAIAYVRDELSVENLTFIAADLNANTSLRIAAARALGEFVGQGLVPDAKELADGTVVDRMVAASMLQNHSDEKAQALLYTLSLDSKPAVAAIAYERLLEVNFVRAREIRIRLSKSPDPNVRLLAAQVIATEPGAGAVLELTAMLNDTSLAVRGYLRKTLIKFGGRPALSDAVSQAMSSTLDKNELSSWRELEQAACIVGKLDYEPASDRLLELINFPRHEVRFAATIALRWMAIESTLPVLLKHCEKLTSMIETSIETNVFAESEPRRTQAETCAELVELAQMFGQMKHGPADPLLRKYISKKARMGEYGRAAGIWALGHINEGQNESQPELVELLKKRYADNNVLNPESLRVRMAAGMSLVHMNAKQHLGIFVWHYNKFNFSKELAGVAIWANEKFTGKKLDPLKPIEQKQTTWVLTPYSE